MAGEAQKVVALGLAVVAAGVIAVLWLPKLFGAAAGPEVELITQLKVAEREGLALPLLDGHLSGKPSYQRMTATVDPAGRRATLTATLDFNGKFGLTEVSSLGVEKIPFVFDGSNWKPETTLAPRLVAVVTALETRRRAFEKRDRPALERLAGTPDAAGLGDEAEQLLSLLDGKLQVDAWFIRLERDSADASEQYRLDGILNDRPFHLSGPRKLRLQSVGGQYSFSYGLM